MYSQPLPAIESRANPSLRVMFEARKRVFVDLLRWDVPVVGEKYEVDEFDTPDAEYLVLTDALGAHRASTRLLRTDRPHILSDLFPFLCESEVPRGPTTREITRFCLEPALRSEQRRRARNQLVTWLTAHALGSGITAMRVVQALHWLRDTMSGDDDGQWRQRLASLLADPVHGADLRADLADGMTTLPAWMQDLLRPLVADETYAA